MQKRILNEIAQCDRESIRGPRLNQGSFVLLFQTKSCVRRSAPEIGDDHVDDIRDVKCPFIGAYACLRTSKLKQLLRQPRQPLQRFLDLARAPGGGSILQFQEEKLRLGQRAGERCSQFVCAVGCEFPLCRQDRTQARQE